MATATEVGMRNDLGRLVDELPGLIWTDVPMTAEQFDTAVDTFNSLPIVRRSVR